MVKMILTTTVLLAMPLVPIAVGQPRSTPQSTKPAAPQTAAPEFDYACYFRSSSGRVQNLSKLCNQQRKPVVTQKADKVKLCYTPDGEYFPCPENGN